MEQTGRIQFQRSAAIPGIEICRAFRSRHRFPKHSHDNLYAFSLMEEGGSSWDGKKGVKSIVRPGCIAAIPAGRIHSGLPHDGDYSTYRMLYIESSVYNEIISDIYENNSHNSEICDNITQNRILIPLFHNLYEAVSAENDQLYLESAASAFIAGIIAELGTKRPAEACPFPSKKILSNAADFLASDLDSKINLEQAAAVAGLSKYHFLRSFKSQFGLSPHLFRTQKRIEAAKEMIKDGIPFSEIAFETGFTDQSHFTNQFRKYIGVTPGQYLGRE